MHRIRHQCKVSDVTSCFPSIPTVRLLRFSLHSSFTKNGRMSPTHAASSSPVGTNALLWEASGKNHSNCPHATMAQYLKHKHFIKCWNGWAAVEGDHAVLRSCQWKPRSCWWILLSSRAAAEGWEKFDQSDEYTVAAEIQMVGARFNFVSPKLQKWKCPRSPARGVEQFVLSRFSDIRLRAFSRYKQTVQTKEIPNPVLLFSTF